MRQCCLIIYASLFSACASLPEGRGDIKDVRIDTSFEAANVSEVIKTENGFRLVIAPEDVPINDSPWFAFDIVGAKNKPIAITLNYQDGTHRYAPKVKTPDGVWQELKSDISISDDKKTASFIITPTHKNIRIAAQPIIDTQDHFDWSKKMAKNSYVTLQTIGRSIEERVIYKLEETDDSEESKPFIVVIGRQHPPEVTGAQALQPFVETVWGNTDIAKRFRENFNLLVIPLLNPDGVASGYWRHNKGGTDLNRDWGPFTQPETKAVQRELERFKSGQDEMVLFLDFHSTWRNLIYTQLDEEPTKPVDFTRKWIENVKNALPKDLYDFTREARETNRRAVAKNYIYHSYSVPAMTFEVGDKTPQESTEAAARIFADEMMALLLEEEI